MTGVQTCALPILERVSELDETIKGMSEELGRKVSVEEVADRLGITEAEIEDILKLAGEEVKDQDVYKRQPER